MVEQGLIVPSPVVQLRLFEEIVQETHELLEKKKSLEGQYIETIIKIGQNLNEMRTRKPYGKFLPWVETEFGLKPRTAQEYMCIATVYGGNTRHGAYFPERVLRVLAAPSTTEEVRQLVEAGHIPATPEAIRAANKARKALKKVEQWTPQEQIVDGTLESSTLIETEETVTNTEYWLVHHCSIADLYQDETKPTYVQPGSLDAIITDPPYPREHLPVYVHLAEFAIHALKPGGSLIAMVGQSYLPDILDMLRKEPLKYLWLACYYVPGNTTKQWQRNIGISWKPLLWFVKGEYTGPWLKDVIKSKDNVIQVLDETVGDIFIGNGKDKKHHEWGQPVKDMIQIIEHFTQPGQLVCDPFVGGGSTAVAAIAQGRSFIGCDIKEECVQRTKQRVKEELARQEKEQEGA